MNKSRLLESIKCFSQQECKRFAEFLRSEYFVKHQDTRALGLYILNLSPHFPSEQLERELVFAIINPDQNFDEKHFAYLMNLLLDQVERFLSQQVFEQEDELKQAFLLEELSRRGLFQLLQSRNDKFIKSSKGRKLKVESSLYDYWKERAVLEGKATQTSVRDLEALENASKNLDEFFILSKLEISLEMLNFNNMGHQVFQPWLLEIVLEEMEKSKDHSPLTGLYYNMYQLYKQPNNDVFRRFLELLFKEEEKIEHHHLKSLYSLAINYCIGLSRILTGDYLQHALELYNRGIDQDYLLDDGYLHHRNFNNIVRLALINGHISWVKKFIDSFQQKIRKQWRDEVVNIALAEVYFYEKNYDATITHLNKLTFIEVGYYINSRIILLKTFYETGSIDSMLYFLAAFVMFLRRNKELSKVVKESNLNFANLLNTIANKLPNQAKSLKSKIQATNPLAEKTWLLQKWGEKIAKE
jgi:hypothetical protein